MKWLPPDLRDTILFLGGLAGVAHETLVAGAERPTLLILFGAMLGLPAFLRADERQMRRRVERIENEDEDNDSGKDQ